MQVTKRLRENSTATSAGRVPTSSAATNAPRRLATKAPYSW